MHILDFNIQLVVLIRCVTDLQGERAAIQAQLILGKYDVCRTNVGLCNRSVIYLEMCIRDRNDP